jgi:hypothetical protein
VDEEEQGTEAETPVEVEEKDAAVTTLRRLLSSIKVSAPL